MSLKKSNAIGHCGTEFHSTAVKRLKARALKKNDENVELSTGEAIASSSTQQKTITTYAREMNAADKVRLQKKIELTHFVASNNLSFSMYEKLCEFGTKKWRVDLGNAYTNRKACAEMAHHISEANFITNVVEPLGSRQCNFFSIFCDGPSSAKTVDEKEIIVVKICKDGEPEFYVLGLEDPDSGLKKALDSYLVRAKLNDMGETSEIGIGTDGAAVNIKNVRVRER